MLTESADSTIELKDNTVIIVLGASGDLAKKKTVSILQLHNHWHWLINF
jgi:glucose-6-phosphate 1-dehydrogenase